MGITSETLDNEYHLSEIIKIPPNVTEEELSLFLFLNGRWVYSNLVYFVKEITLLYDS